MLGSDADLKGLCWIHHRQDFSGRCITPDTSVGSLSLRERAGVRVLMVGAQPMRRPESAFGESIIAKTFQVDVW